MAFLREQRRWEAKDWLESPGCSQAVPPHWILPCLTERGTLKSLCPAQHHLNSFFSGFSKSRGSKAAANQSSPLRKHSQGTPGHAPVTREVRAARTASPGLPRPAGDHLAGGRGGGCPGVHTGEEEEGAGAGAALSFADAAVTVSRGYGTRWPQAGLFPHPPAGQDGSGSAQSEAAVPAVLFLPGQSVASLSAIFTKSQRHCRFVWQAGYLSPGDDGKGVSGSSARNQQLPPCLLSVLPAW